LVLAVPDDSRFTASRISGQAIATEVVNVTKRWLAQHGVEALVELVGAPPRSTRPAGRCHCRGDRDRHFPARQQPAIVLICCRAPHDLCNQAASVDPWKRQKMDDLILMIQGAMAAGVKWA